MMKSMLIQNMLLCVKNKTIIGLKCLPTTRVVKTIPIVKNKTIIGLKLLWKVKLVFS